MSYKATAWAYDLPLRGPAKPILTALADFADEAGSCYPGQEKLCHMTGLSLRTVRRALDRLDRLGLISRERRFDPYGHRTSDRYYLHLEVQSLPATLTSGHTDLRSESPSLPATQSIPTGHSDRVTISRTTSDPLGGRQAPEPAPTPVDNSDLEPSPVCPRHPDGIDAPCALCKKHRLAWEQWAINRVNEQQWRLTTKKAVIHIDGLCDAHRQPEHTCDACAEDRRKGRAS